MLKQTVASGSFFASPSNGNNNNNRNENNGGAATAVGSLFFQPSASTQQQQQSQQTQHQSHSSSFHGASLQGTFAHSNNNNNGMSNNNNNRRFGGNSLSNLSSQNQPIVSDAISPVSGSVSPSAASVNRFDDAPPTQSVYEIMASPERGMVKRAFEEKTLNGNLSAMKSVRFNVATPAVSTLVNGSVNSFHHPVSEAFTPGPAFSTGGSVGIPFASLLIFGIPLHVVPLSNFLHMLCEFGNVVKFDQQRGGSSSGSNSVSNFVLVQFDSEQGAERALNSLNLKLWHGHILGVVPLVSVVDRITGANEFLKSITPHSKGAVNRGYSFSNASQSIITSPMDISPNPLTASSTRPNYNNGPLFTSPTPNINNNNAAIIYDTPAPGSPLLQRSTGGYDDLKKLKSPTVLKPLGNCNISSNTGEVRGGGGEGGIVQKALDYIFGW